MEEGILAITIIAILSGSIITIVKSVLGYRERTRFGTESKKGIRSREPEGASLTTTELEDMMRRAVSDATAPLADRMDLLESRVAAKAEPGEDNLLAESPDPIEPAPVRKTIGSRTS